MLLHTSVADLRARVCRIACKGTISYSINYTHGMHTNVKFRLSCTIIPVADLWPDKMHWCCPSDDMCSQLQPKKTKVRKAVAISC